MPSAISDCLTEYLAKTTGSLFSRDIALHMQAHPMVKQQDLVEPEQFRFKDDGVFPNSVLPLWFIGKHSQRRRKIALPVLNNALLRTTGPIHGEMAFIPSLIITAQRMKRWESIVVLRRYDSAASTAGTSRCMPAT